MKIDPLETLVAGTGLVAAGSFLGQVLTAPDVAPTWLSIVIQFGSFGLVAYLVTVGLPAFQKDVKAERKAERDDYATNIAIARGDFLKVIENQRTDFAAGIKTLAESYKAEAEMLRATFVQEQRDTREFLGARLRQGGNPP